jgi:hypothetical protein
MGTCCYLPARRTEASLEGFARLTKRRIDLASRDFDTERLDHAAPAVVTAGRFLDGDALDNCSPKRRL